MGGLGRVGLVGRVGGWSVSSGTWLTGPAALPPDPPDLPDPPDHFGAASHACTGSVPARNASRTTCGQRGRASLPVSASMSTKLMPSGASNGTLGWPASARIMNCVQMGSAACAPLRARRGWLSSKPTHTTVRSSGVKPTNQASRRSLVVPVLPAASSVKPAARAPAPVPSLMHAAHHVRDEKRRVGPRDRAASAPASSSSRPCRRCVISQDVLERPHGAADSGKSCRRSRSRTASPRIRRARWMDTPWARCRRRAASTAPPRGRSRRPGRRGSSRGCASGRARGGT